MNKLEEIERKLELRRMTNESLVVVHSMCDTLGHEDLKWLSEEIKRRKLNVKEIYNRLVMQDPKLFY